MSAWASVRTPSRRKSTSALSALRSNSYNSILDTTTVLLLDVDPQSLHFEDDAVVFSSHLPQSRRVAAPECLHSCLLPLLWPGFYTTPRDSNSNSLGHGQPEYRKPKDDSEDRTGKRTGHQEVRSYQAIHDADDAARPKQSRHHEGSALPRDRERSDRQDGNGDARPWREPSPQRTTHRDDDHEHDQRCGREANCQHGLGTRHRTSSGCFFLYSSLRWLPRGARRRSSSSITFALAAVTTSTPRAVRCSWTARVSSGFPARSTSPARSRARMSLETCMGSRPLKLASSRWLGREPARESP